MFDYWSVVHFIAGSLVAVFGELSWLRYWQTILLGLFLFITWEMFESMKGIRETTANKVADIIVALVGMAFIFWLSYSHQTIFVIIGLIFVILLPIMAHRGWKAHLKRKGRKVPGNLKENYRSLKKDISNL